MHNARKFTRVQNKVPVVVERLLYSAAEAAKQQVIVMTEEDSRVSGEKKADLENIVTRLLSL